MDHFHRIYSSQAMQYHRMIAVEDVDGNLRPALEAMFPFQGKRLLDLGSGTGRIPLLFHQDAASVVALDLHQEMLQEQLRQRHIAEGKWDVVQGDMRSLPLPIDSFDIVTAGWAIGHLRGWYPETWQQQMSLALEEMHRVAADGGALIILETLSTGSLVPTPPTAGLAEYYTWLETEWGFARREIQTDYSFEDVEQAVAYTEFFFGAELGQKIRAQGWARLPEWTGVWGKIV